VLTRDKAKGIGIALLLWFFFSLLYDAIVLFIMFSFSDYPLEKPMLALICLNPIDLARVNVMLQMDIAALMGYTGALFQKVLGTNIGMAVGWLIYVVWIAVPLWVAVRLFCRKDL
jgi:Cu-processing system permease protein